VYSKLCNDESIKFQDAYGNELSRSVFQKQRNIRDRNNLHKKLSVSF